MSAAALEAGYWRAIPTRFNVFPSLGYEFIRSPIRDFVFHHSWTVNYPIRVCLCLSTVLYLRTSVVSAGRHLE